MVGFLLCQGQSILNLEQLFLLFGGLIIEVVLINVVLGGVSLYYVAFIKTLSCKNY